MKVKFWKKKLSNIGAKNIGEGSVIHSHTWFGKKVKIGKRCRIQAFSFIPDGVEFEDDVFIGPHVCFTNDRIPPSFGKFWQETLIKRGAAIGANSTILCGITIGEEALIGAGSVVLKDVPAGEIWAGNPAVYLRKK